MHKSSQGELHITVIGRRGVGKSLLVDRIMDIETSSKSISSESKDELLSRIAQLTPSGPDVNIIIARIEGQNTQRVDVESKWLKSISDSDLAILVLDAREELDDNETYVITHFQKRKLPFLIAINKIEFGTNSRLLTELEALEVMYFEISCKENAGLESMKKKMIHLLPQNTNHN